MRKVVLAAVAAAALALGGVAACKLDGGGTGYIEIRTVPAAPPPSMTLFLGGAKLDPFKKGSAVLRQSVGTHKLGVATSGDPILLCELVVKKDRITTVTVSLLERPPRCQCRATSGTDAASNKRCEG